MRHEPNAIVNGVLLVGGTRREINEAVQIAERPGDDFARAG